MNYPCWAPSAWHRKGGMCGLSLDAISAYADYESLLAIINRRYPVEVDRVTLLREMIGYVYAASCRDDEKYILKLHRPAETANALSGVGVADYLAHEGFPVARIVPSRSGDKWLPIDTPAGRSVGILSVYVAGSEPDVETEITALGGLAGRLHVLMAAYPGHLPRRGKEFYVDRFIELLRSAEYPAGRIHELEQLGERLWDHLRGLPEGFCHGDLHTGNMVRTGPGEYVLLDWDVASEARSVIDVATLCDGTDFNRLESSGYGKTMQRLERFRQGYELARPLSRGELAAVPAFIAIRHFELIATIIGLRQETVSTEFLDEQYHWLLDWEDICRANS